MLRNIWKFTGGAIAIVVLLLVVVWIVGCGKKNPIIPTSDTSLSWNSVNDFIYQLQNVDLTAIGNTRFGCH